MNQRTSYSYDADGNLAQTTPARGNATSYEYNLRNQRSRQVLPNGADELYTYDVAGNLASRRGANGKVTSYSYDALNRLSSITPDASLGEPAISYTYKLNGQRATLTDISGATTYNYDNRNRLTSKQTPFGTLSYGYDATSNLTSTQSSNTNGLSVTYGYDALNRLQTVTDNRITPGVTSYVYDEVGNLKNTTQPNGVQHDYTYNPVNLLTQLNVVKGASTLARYTYTHTAARLRASMTELNGRTVTYAYDDANQLNSETTTNAPNAAQNGIISYVLDAVGNRLQRNSTASAIPSTVNTFNSANQLNTDSYDLNGNTIAADGKTYAYDFRDKLKSVNTGTIALAYDGDGNRVRKTVGGVTTNYLVDELNPTGYAQVVEEIVGGQVQRVYTYGNVLISQRQLIGSNWVTSHYGYDGSENVRLLTDGAGGVSDTFDYDAFGNLIGRTGTTANSYLYRGQQFDADLGFYYKRARYYSQQRGRFISADTFEGLPSEPRSLHRYLYAHADPLNNSDPSGLASFPSTALAQQSLTGQLIQVGGAVVRGAGAGFALYNLGKADACTAFTLADIIYKPTLGNLVLAGILHAACTAIFTNAGDNKAGDPNLPQPKTEPTPNPRQPIFADTDLLVGAAEKGHAASLDEIRGGTTYITQYHYNEFMNVNTEAQRQKREAFLTAEGITIYPGTAVEQNQAYLMVFNKVAPIHGVSDAALGGYAKVTGYEAVTRERRLTNLYNLSYPKLGVPIRRVL